jgi:thioredoxin 1
MKTTCKKTLLVTALVVVAASMVLTHGNRSSQSGCCCPSIVSMTAFAAEAAKATGTNATAKAGLPRLVDLGADKCIPCKAMAPILKELKAEYAGRMDVEFIDVWKDPKAAKPYRIKLIPTQIFFDATGKERFRHQGFLGKEDILAKWKELGVDLKSEARNPKSEGSSKPEESPKPEGKQGSQK